MQSFSARAWSFTVGSLCIALIAAIGILQSRPVAAAPPYAVTYKGAAVTTGVPGKAFTVNWEVTNTGNTEYSGVKVIYHIPEGLSHSKVSPANAGVIDDIISWENVPIGAGKSFYPSLTLTVDKGTALKTKKNIWVEVTGDDMEANSQNFSITAVAKQPTTTTTTTTATTSSSQVTSLFTAVYGRALTASESTYWTSRLTDKPERLRMFGAMQFHKLLGISH